MVGFFKWVRRRVHGEQLYSFHGEAAFDEDTEALIEGSIALLERMRSKGVNILEPKRVTHLFLGLDRNLLRAEKLLSRDGYSPEEYGNGRLLLSERTTITEAWIRQVVPAMCQTAGEFDLVYDGWDIDLAGSYTGQDNCV